MHISISRLLQLTPLISALCLAGVPIAEANAAGDRLADSVIDNILEGMEAQSPIDIRSDNTYFGRLSPLHFNLSSDTDLSVINNGSPSTESTIRTNVAAGEGSLTVDGKTYSLAQFHFHEPSEHLENSKPTPMEMHMVFANADNLVVVGRWVNEGSFNSALGPIFADLPQTVTETKSVDNFNLNSLLPDTTETFRYTGSLTTPPFTEGVKWINFAEPLEMSAAQIQAFETLFPEGNARPVQPLNGRIILTDLPGFVTAVPEPETYAMLLAGLGLLVLVGNFKNKRHTANIGFMNPVNCGNPL
ncbi:MAG: carbonate dehydratase [Nitrosomonadales bacterium SCN 54-20]|nr:MAG: carbonate dehydratase [Nitrosomonadales bacterium SCN 54-20]